MRKFLIIIATAIGCVAPDVSLFGPEPGPPIPLDAGTDAAKCLHCKSVLDVAFGDGGSFDPGQLVSDLCADDWTGSATAWRRIATCACGLPAGPIPACPVCAAWCAGQRNTPLIWIAPGAACATCVYDAAGCYEAAQLCGQDDGLP